MILKLYNVIQSGYFILVLCVQLYDMNSLFPSPQMLRIMYPTVNIVNYTSSLQHHLPLAIMAFRRDLNISVAVPWALA